MQWQQEDGVFRQLTVLFFNNLYCTYSSVFFQNLREIHIFYINVHVSLINNNRHEFGVWIPIFKRYILRLVIND